MEKYELYHLHVHCQHDKYWHEKAVIDIKQNFKNRLFNNYQNFTVGIPVEGLGLITLYDKILISKLQNPNHINRDLLEEMIEEAYKVSYNASVFKRETAVENFRKDNNITYPSRLHSVYMTDEQGIESWHKKLNGGGKKVDIYRVEVEGNILKTSEYFLPSESLTYEQAYEEAYKYWKPNFKKIPNDANEYLVQGKIKVLEKINK